MPHKKEKVLPGAQPFTHHTKEKNFGCFLIHGFTGTPYNMKYLGDDLYKEGFANTCPRMPGHGTCVEDLNATSWQDIQNHLLRELKKFARDYKKIVIIGESSGAVLACHFAVNNPRLVHGIVSVGGAFKYRFGAIMSMIAKIFSFFQPAPKKWMSRAIKNPQARKDRVMYRRFAIFTYRGLLKLTKQIIKELPKVKVPLLIQQSIIDYAISPKSANLLKSKASSKDKKIIWYFNGYHSLLVDYDRKKVTRDIIKFLRKIKKRPQE